MDAQTAAIVAQLGREIAGLQRKIATLERGARTTQLAGAVIDGDLLQFADDSGNVVHSIGLQADGSVAAVSSSPSGPVQPSTPTVTAGTLGCVVTWDGLMSDGTAPLSDFAQTQIHISTTNGFIPDSTTFVAAITGPGTRAISNLAPGTTYYVVLVAFNASGIPSPASAQASVVPIQVTGSFIANLTASLIGNLGTLNPNPYFIGADSTGWTATAGSFNVTSTPSAGAAYKYAGVYANNGSGAGAAKGIAGGPTSSWFPVVAGSQYMVTAQINTTATSVQSGFDWYNSAGTFISSAGLVTTALTANTWTQITTVSTAPAGAAYAVQRVGSPSGDNAVTQIQACLSMPQVPGSLIQAGTVTASQIAAGVIVAGIVDGTIISGAQFIAHGSSGEFLAYSGTPATGNLVESISPVSGTDSHSNAYKAGFVAYSSVDSSFAQLKAGDAITPAGVQIGTGLAQESSPGLITSGFTVSGTARALTTTVASPLVTTFTGSAQTQWTSSFNDGTQAFAFPSMVNIVMASGGVNGTVMRQDAVDWQFQKAGGGVYLDIDIVNNRLTAGYPIYGPSNGAAGASSPDLWHTLTVVNGWANAGGGLAQLQYMRMAGNEIWLIGVLNPASFTSTTIGTLPSGYRPIGAAFEDSFEFHTSTGAGLGCFLRIGATGAIQAVNATTGMGAIGINTRISLDTIT